MTTITELQVIFQRPVDESEIPDIQDLVDQKIFATQGQTEVVKYIQTSTGYFIENTLHLIHLSAPVGAAGIKDAVRAAVLRLMRTMKEWDPQWVQFYVIAKFEGAGDEGPTEFFRTIIPRTEIPVSIRNIRRRNLRNRKSGFKPHRRVRRKAV